MAETSGFYDAEELVSGDYDREYVSEQFAQYFALFIGNGVYASPTNQLKVVAGEGMNIIVKKGWAFIKGRWYHNDSDLVISVPPNTTAATINSGVFVQHSQSDRDIHSIIATGRTTPDREAPYWELKIAELQIPTGTTAITDAMITDTRTDESVCGFVKGLLQGVIPTADLFAQYDAIFMDFYNRMKDQLSEDAAGHLQNEIDKNTKDINSIQSQICTNLLNLTAPTQTVNGVTFTSNGDGTYTVHGTAVSNNAVIYLGTIDDTDLSVSAFQNSKLVGCPKGGSMETYFLGIDMYHSATWVKAYQDIGNGVISNIPSNIDRLNMYILINKGVTVNNLIFKPMITTDLSATYDDFVPYIGDSGRLNEDVANLKSNSAVVGSMTIFAGSVVPDGYLLCDGQAVSRSEYSKLFEVIGTTWGAGDGSTTFNVPDMREVAPVGIGESTRTEEAHDTYTLGQFKDDQLQSHTHSIRYWATRGDSSISGSAGSNLSDKSGTGNNNGRTGTVTRGKRIGVNYIIKY